MKINHDEIRKFCKKWKVEQVALFGSIVRDDFTDSSDVDVLIKFSPNITWGFEIATMRDELVKIFGRPVDLVNRLSIEQSRNHYKRDEILNNCKIIYDEAA